MKKYVDIIFFLLRGHFHATIKDKKEKNRFPMPQKNQNPLSDTKKEIITISHGKPVRFDVRPDHGSFSPSHWHDAIEIIYILEGTTIVTIFDQTITLEPGQFLLINSGLVHASRCPASGNRAILLQIPDELLASCLPEASRPWFVIDSQSPDPEIPLRIRRLCEILLDMMHLQEAPRPGYLFAFQRDLFEFLDILYSNFLHDVPPEYQPRSSRTQSRLDAVLQHTHQNYSRPITLREAADVAALQPEYFCRFFRETMGTTYLQYLNDYRLSRLYRDLLATDLPIRELEEKHGFSNDKLFHRLFRERFRTTPLKARKSAQSRKKGFPHT